MAQAILERSAVVRTESTNLGADTVTALDGVNVRLDKQRHLVRDTLTKLMEESNRFAADSEAELQEANDDVVKVVSTAVRHAGTSTSRRAVAWDQLSLGVLLCLLGVGVNHTSMAVRCFVVD